MAVPEEVLEVAHRAKAQGRLLGRKQYNVRYLYGIALSTSERSLVGVPILMPSAGADVTRVVSFNIARGTFTKQADVEVSVFTGSNHRDRNGNLYQSAFEWDHDCRLAVLIPSPRRSMTPSSVD